MKSLFIFPFFYFSNSFAQSLSLEDSKYLFDGANKVEIDASFFGRADIDFRGWDTPIKDQGNRGLCTSFAVNALMENFAKRRGVELDLSEIHLWSLYQRYNMYDAVNAAQNNFIYTESMWPYYYANPFPGSYGVVSLGNSISESVWDSLSSYRPVIFGVDTTGYWSGANNGVIPAYGNVTGGHAFEVVGSVSNSNFPGGGYFVFKNSWGSNWGDKGYGYLPWGYCQSYRCYSITLNSITLR